MRFTGLSRTCVARYVSTLSCISPSHAIRQNKTQEAQLPASRCSHYLLTQLASMAQQVFLLKKCLRLKTLDISILLLNGEGETIAETGAGLFCNPVTWADPTLQIKWMDFWFSRLLDIAAQSSGIERENLCIHYHAYHIMNQGCLGVAVHGFSNGFRTNTAIEFTVAPIARCSKKRKRCSSLSVANSADKLFRLYCCDQPIRRRVATGGRWFMNGRPAVIS
jgi:hypothetical protein